MQDGYTLFPKRMPIYLCIIPEEQEVAVDKSMGFGRLLQQDAVLRGFLLIPDMRWDLIMTASESGARSNSPRLGGNFRGGKRTLVQRDIEVPSDISQETWENMAQQYTRRVVSSRPPLFQGIRDLAKKAKTQKTSAVWKQYMQALRDRCREQIGRRAGSLRERELLSGGRNSA